MGRFAASVLLIFLAHLTACVPLSLSDPVLAAAQADLETARRSAERSAAQLQAANALVAQRVDEIMARQDDDPLYVERKLVEFLLGGQVPLMLWLPMFVSLLLLVRFLMGFGELELRSRIRELERHDRFLDERLAQHQRIYAPRWSPPV